jgi:uncharacterized membrane protein HdeD (DUF308 family)
VASTVLLSKVLGSFMIIFGIAALLRSRPFAEVIATFARDLTWRTLWSALELLAGLFLVTMHRKWDSAPAIVVSTIGWLAVLESTAYLVLPDRLVQSFLMPFAKPAVVAACGVLSLVLGIYLAAYGFGA